MTLQTGLYYLKTSDEAGQPHFYPATFADLGQGIDKFVRLGRSEFKYIMSLGQNLTLKNWCANSTDGTIYQTYTSSGILYYRWLRIPVDASVIYGGQTIRQMVKVLEVSADGKMVKIDTIHKVQNGDYSSYSPDKQPWLFGKVYTYYGPNHYGLSHNGILFVMPYFYGGFALSKGLPTDGLWIKSAWLFEPVPFHSLPGPTGTTNTFGNGVGTISDLKTASGVKYHVMRFPLARASFFVSPCTKTPPNTGLFTSLDVLQKYQLHLCWNADGFNFLYGSPDGRWWRENQKYFESINESSIYVGQDNIPTLTRPQSIWNCLSFPELLIKDGAVQASLDIKILKPLSMWGWDDTTATVIIVDGVEYQSGMTIADGAKLLQSYGVKFGVLNDSGGSAQAAVNCDGLGVQEVSPVGNDRDEQGHPIVRAVSTCWGVRLK